MRVRGGGVQLTGQHCGEQFAHARPGQRPQLDPLHQIAFPQRPDRLRHGVTVAHRGDHDSGTRRGELVRQAGRGIVEQVRVVHAEHQRAVGTAPTQLGVRAAQQVQRAAGDPVTIRKQVREGTEGDLRQRPVGDHPGGRPTRCGREAERFVSQPGLAHPSCAEQHDATSAVLGDQPVEERHLLRTADQRPARAHPASIGT
jgi:hypothetical protein